jgi:hypothetical protein
MACTLTSGRTEPCRDSVGGLKAIRVIDFQEDAFTITAGEATAIDIGVTAAYKYELLADGNTFAESGGAPDESTGTSVVTQTGTVVLKKQDVATANEINILKKARPIVVYEFRDGTHKIQGISDGTVISVETASGGAKGDFNGYTLTITSTEVELAPTLDAATVTALKALSGGVTINP